MVAYLHSGDVFRVDFADLDIRSLEQTHVEREDREWQGAKSTQSKELVVEVHSGVSLRVNLDRDQPLLYISEGELVHTVLLAHELPVEIILILVVDLRITCWSVEQCHPCLDYLRNHYQGLGESLRRLGCLTIADGPYQL